MIIAVAFTVSIIYPTMSIILSGQQSSYKHIQIWTNLSSARPLAAVRWPCLPSTFIFSLILKASLSLPPSQPVPLINSTHSISFSLFPFLSCLTCLSYCEGVSTMSLTMVPVFVSPSSSCSPLTQCVLLAWCLQNLPRSEMMAEGMKKIIKKRGMERK